MLRIFIGMLMVIGLHAQESPATPAGPKFEVASLKPSAPGGRGGGIRPQGGERYVATNAPLGMMITVAWRLKNEQVIGGPDWLNTAGFDMNAKAEKTASVEELHRMLQNLLAERFKLQFHWEKKELPIYALTVDKGGPQMQPHEAATAGRPWIDRHNPRFWHRIGHGNFAPMEYFAWRLGQLLDRPVVDMTNLKGGYDFDLSFTRELPPGISETAQVNGQQIDTSGPSIFAALQKQLGLKLERQKGPVEIMVIDHVVRPSEN